MSTRVRTVVFLSVVTPALVMGCVHAAQQDQVAAVTTVAHTGCPLPAATPDRDLVCARGPLGPPDPKPTNDLACDPNDVNLEPLELAIACRTISAGSAAPRARWDHATPPVDLDLVERRFGLTTDEGAHLMKDGFVVPTRLSYSSYAPALHDVYRSQLLLYVTIDSIMHAVYRSNDTFIAGLEARELSPRLTKMLATMQETLVATQGKYPAETARDLDLHLTVARSLLLGQKSPSALGMHAEAETLVTQAEAASGVVQVTMFCARSRRRLRELQSSRPLRAGGGAEQSGLRRPLDVLARGDVALAHRDEPGLAVVT